MTANPPVPSEAQYSQVCFLGDDKRDCFNKGFAVGYNARDVIAQQEAFTRQVNESAERVAQWPAHKIDGAEDTIARLEAEVAELLADYDRALEHCDTYWKQLQAAPRRTPELTERVAVMLINQELSALGWKPVSEASEPYMKRAVAVLDLVLGKEPSGE